MPPFELSPLRLVVYDRTCRGRKGHFLSEAWWLGTRWHGARGRIHFSHGASSWHEALDFLTRIQPGTPIAEVQFWGHGKWGDARIDGDVFDERALLRHSPLSSAVSAFAARLEKNARFWFRTCETLGAERGQDFARSFADRLNVTVAGHTYVIGLWQSGLHVLAPGEAPSWDPEEGLLAGTADRPEKARISWPSEPNTITCFTADIPAEFAVLEPARSTR